MTSLTTPAAEPAADRSTEDRAARIERLRAAAYRIRLNALNMGEVQGQGYIGQASVSPTSSPSPTPTS